MDDATKSGIEAHLLEILAELEPDASTRAMYGGTVIEMRDRDPKSRIGGIFSYEAHVSLELTNGSFLDDPEGHLEGGGKQRRHVKLRSLEDIEGKTCRAFLRAAISDFQSRS